jgi:hypothetical protein
VRDDDPACDGGDDDGDDHADDDNPPAIHWVLTFLRTFFIGLKAVRSCAAHIPRRTRMLTSYFTVKPAAAPVAAPKKAANKKVVPPRSPEPPSPSPSPAIDASYMDAAIDDEADVGSVVDSLDGGGEVLETPISECADRDFPDTLSDVSDEAVAADDLAADDDIFTLLRSQSRRSLDVAGPELCCDDEDF